MHFRALFRIKNGRKKILKSALNGHMCNVLCTALWEVLRISHRGRQRPGQDVKLPGARRADAGNIASLVQGWTAAPGQEGKLPL